MLFASYSYALPLIPDDISLPARLKNSSATQIKAVFSSLEKQHGNKTANLWFLKYRKALLLKKKDEELSCKILKELSETVVFPLKDLALIESYGFCSYPEGLKFDPDQFPKWLRLKLAKTFYERRKVFENPKQTLQATAYLAQNSAYKELRISYLKHALSLANEQEDEKEALGLTQLLYKEAPRLKPNPVPEDYFSYCRGFETK